MIYSGFTYETKTNSSYYDDIWHINYHIFQSRTSNSGISESRSLLFSKSEPGNFDSVYNKLMGEIYKELSDVKFDLFEISDKKFLTLKERLEDGETKDNQIAEN